MKYVSSNRYSLLVCGLFVAGAPASCAQGEPRDTDPSLRSLALTAVADEGQNVAFEWNQIFIDTLIATNTANSLSQRLGAIVHAAMFDAYNGVDGEYEPLFYREPAEGHSNARAALVAASYTMLVTLFSTQKPELDDAYAAALASLEDACDGEEVQHGLDYGISVAQAVLHWRSSDGFSTAVPAFTGGTSTGQWRPTPPALAAMSAQPLAFTQDFVAGSSQFRPSAPRDLLSATYTEDFDTVKALGGKTHSARSARQTELAPFWEGNATIHWNQAANQAAHAEHLSLSKSVRLFTALNVAMADTAFTTFSAKRFYGADPTATTWRPVTAILLADSDGNPGTLSDANWEPLVTTPSHPEFPAGHPSLNGAAATILLSVFADAQTFTLTTAGLPSQTYSSISQARQDGNDARVWGGMHYPSTCAISDALGASIAEYVNTSAMRQR